MLTVNDLRTSLRKPKFGDDDLDADEDKLLQRSLDAAQSYVKDAVGCDDTFLALPENVSTYETVVLAIAGAYFQNPVAVQAGGAPVVVNLVSNNLVGQLRARWEVSQDGTTSDSSTVGSTDATGQNGVNV